MRHISGGAFLVALGFVLMHSAVPGQKAKLEPPSALQLWSSFKRELTGPDGQKYFDQNLSGSMVPGGAGGVEYFTGTLLSAEPAEQPRVLVLAISDRSTPEVTLRFKNSKWDDTHITGPLMRGSVIQFEGVPISFTQEPFMLTFGVSTTERSHIRLVRRQAR